MPKRRRSGGSPRPLPLFALRLSVERLEERSLLAAVVAGSDYEADSLLVRFRPEINPAAIVQSLLSSSQIGRSFGSLVPGLTELKLSSGSDVSAAAALLRASPWVEYAEPNYEMHVEATIPNDPSFGSLYALNNTGQSGGTPDADIDAAEAWDVTHGSSSVIVAVIDTGIDYNHPDLAANIWTNDGEIAGDNIDNDSNGFIDDVRGWDFVNHDNDPQDDYGHGTHVAGTIGAIGNNGIGVAGINWNVKLMPLKFIAANGYGSTADAITALQYAVANGARISNNSYGDNNFSQAFLDALNLATAGDQHLFVAAAGNGNYFGQPVNIDQRPFYPAAYKPAIDDLVSVAATDNKDKVASFSNYGGQGVDLAAPGVNIYSTVPGNKYENKSGTSMASPHVAGAAALVWAANPSLTASQVKDLLLSTTDPIGALNPTRPTLTNGRLNVNRAIQGVGTPIPPAEPDELPTVSIDSPASGDPVVGQVTITTSVSDDHGVTKVEFFAGSTKIGEDTSEIGGWSFDWNTTTLVNGPFVLTARATDTVGQTKTSIGVNVTVNNPEPPTSLYFSLSTDGTVGGLSVANEDIVAMAGTKFSKFFDGSDVGVSSRTLDAFAFLSPTEIVMSFTGAATISGISVDDSDLVKFTATSLGENTAGSWSMYFDGSDVGLSSDSEDVDSLAFLPDGSLLVSTFGSFSVTGASGNGEDILRFVPTSLGATTAGTWSVYFDGSDVSLSGSAENLDGLAVDTAGLLYLSTTGNFSVTGRTGANEDIFTFTPTQTGATTKGSFSPTLFFDGSVFGLSGNNVTDIELPPSALSLTAASSIQQAQTQAFDLVYYDLGLATAKNKTRR